MEDQLVQRQTMPRLIRCHLGERQSRLWQCLAVKYPDTKIRRYHHLADLPLQNRDILRDVIRPDGVVPTRGPAGVAHRGRPCYSIVHRVGR